MASRTLLRQDAQINASLTFNQTLAAGSTLQSSAITLEDDLNALRSQQSRMLDATGAGNWYDAINTTDGKTRGIKQLNVSLDTIETKPLLQRVQSLTSIAVPSGQNYVILSNANSQTPSYPIAISLTTNGAVVAASSNNGSAFAANELTAVAGASAVNPKNICLVHDAALGQVIESGGEDVYALIQVESTATDGGAFNDTSAGNRAKLSFVTINWSTGALQAAAAADIGGKTIQYTYAQRLIFANLPEQAFLGTGTFADNIAQVDVTLTSAVVNQNGTPVPVGSNVLWNLASGKSFAVQNAAGSQQFYAVGSTGATTLNVPSLNITSTAAPTVTAGMTVATASQAVNVGTTAGQVDSATLTLKSTTGPLQITSATTESFTDGFLAGSSYTASAVKLAASSTEYSTFATNFGTSASIISAINQAASKANHIQAAGWAGSTIAAGTAVTISSLNMLNGYSASTLPISTDFVGECQVYLNGNLLIGGATSAAYCDVYPGPNYATTGELCFQVPLRNLSTHADVIQIVVQQGSYST